MFKNTTINFICRVFDLNSFKFHKQNRILITNALLSNNYRIKLIDNIETINGDASRCNVSKYYISLTYPTKNYQRELKKSLNHSVQTDK